ncbi:MAG: hypothetical protein GQ570_11165 [Helicobacteraceae bacterium]|nr:hypothetical protein [Helicobacteraceae bacterium]
MALTKKEQEALNAQNEANATQTDPNKAPKVDATHKEYVEEHKPTIDEIIEHREFLQATNSVSRAFKVSFIENVPERPATKYNSETKQQEAQFNDDGSPILWKAKTLIHTRSEFGEVIMDYPQNVEKGYFVKGKWYMGIGYVKLAPPRFSTSPKNIEHIEYTEFQALFVTDRKSQA